MILYENNCIDKCPDKYYLDDNRQCQECNNLCQIYLDNNCTQCTSCIDGFYLKKNSYECLKCHYTCKTCEQEEEIDNAHCLSCHVNSEYKYLVDADGFGKNCVNKCPNKTTLKEGKCVLEEEKKEEEKEEEGEKEEEIEENEKEGKGQEKEEREEEEKKEEEKEEEGKEGEKEEEEEEEKGESEKKEAKERLKDKEKEEGEVEGENKYSLAIIIPSIIGGIIVISIIILIIRRHFKKRGLNNRDRDQLINETNQELQVCKSFDS